MVGQFLGVDEEVGVQRACRFARLPLQTLGDGEVESSASISEAKASAAAIRLATVSAASAVSSPASSVVSASAKSEATVPIMGPKAVSVTA